MGVGIARRTVLVAGASAAAAALVPLPARTQDSVTVDEFRALSARLTGVAMASLDAKAAGELLEGFVSMGRGGDLALLAAGRETGGAVANDIVAAWYSGHYATPAGAAAIDLTKALLWNALDFTKPRGVCGGPTGYWAEPYQN
jgi:hypothetical protein